MPLRTHNYHCISELPKFLLRFPENKTGLVLIFSPKFTLGLISEGCLILMYQKIKLQSKN